MKGELGNVSGATTILSRRASALPAQAGIQEAHDREPALFKPKTGARALPAQAGIQEAHDREPALFKPKTGARALPAQAGIQEAHDREPALFKPKTGARALPAQAGIQEAVGPGLAAPNIRAKAPTYLNSQEVNSLVSR